jgi:hypothetical protein
MRISTTLGAEEEEEEAEKEEKEEEEKAEEEEEDFFPSDLQVGLSAPGAMHLGPPTGHIGCRGRVPERPIQVLIPVRSVRVAKSARVLCALSQGAGD